MLLVIDYRRVSLVRRSISAIQASLRTVPDVHLMDSDQMSLVMPGFVCTAAAVANPQGRTQGV